MPAATGAAARARCAATRRRGESLMRCAKQRPLVAHCDITNFDGRREIRMR